ncbi:MAG: O-antigen ligase family protein [Phycisphaerales bacterium]
MTSHGRQKTGGRPEAAGRRDTFSLQPPASSLLLILCILALRVTYTEAPTAQTMTLTGSLVDTIYSLSLSGLLIFAFVGWFLCRFIAGRWTYRVTGMEIGLLLFIVAAVVSSLGASDKRAAINHVAILLAPAIAALLLVQILDSPDKVRLVLIVVVALGIVSAYQCAEQFFLSNAITIEQYEKDPNMLLGPLGIEPGTFQHFLFEHRLYSRGIRGFFTTSNSAASFAICASFAAIALFAGKIQDLKTRKEAGRYAAFGLLAVVLVVAGLGLTHSKGGIIAFVAGLGVFGLLMALDRRSPVHKRRILTLLVPAALLGVIALGCVAAIYGLRHGRLPGGNSMLVRWQYWVASAAMFEDHPLTGVGPGNFSDYYPHYKPPAALESVADPHNWPLSLIAQYGPLGLIGFLAILWGPLWWSIRRPAAIPVSDDSPCQQAGRVVPLVLLVAVGLCLLLIRPLLIPMSGGDSDFDLWLYEVITVFVTPAAAFLIGFLLVATPFEQDQSAPHDIVRSAQSASLAGAVVAVLLHNLIDFAIFEPGVWMAFWILLACLVATRLHKEPTCLAAPCPSSQFQWLAGGVALALLGAYVAWIWMPVFRTTIGIRKSQRATASGRLDAAHDALARATKADRLSPTAASLNGRLYMQQYDQSPHKPVALLDEAQRCFHEAISRAPAAYKDYEKLGIVNAQSGKCQEAYDWYLKAAELYPGCDRLWFELGQLAERLDKPEAARAHYSRAIAIEDAYREQFRRMYPEREQVVSRLGEKEYRLAQERVAKLTPANVEPEGLTTKPQQ